MHRFRSSARPSLPALLAALLVLLAGPALAQSLDRLMVAQGTDVASLDPQMQNDAFSTSLLSNVFDTLIYRNADLELVPGLATEWRTVDDTTWELQLREGVSFHDGSTLEAEDVEFTLERPLDESLGSPLASRFAVIEDVEVTGPLSVRIHTHDPYPLLPARLSEWFVVSKDYVESTDQATLSEEPVGTGAYRVVEWVKDDRLELRAFEDHWRGAPEAQEVAFRPIPELSTRVAALQAGDVDLITNVPANRTDAVDNDPALDVRDVPSTYIQYVALDGTKNEALSDVRVRKAIQYATNVDEIIEFLFDGNAVKIGTPLAHGTFGLNEDLEPYPHDPERARELLAEAGYPDGISFEMDAPVGRYAQDQEVAEALVGQWSDVGIDVDLNLNDWSVQLTKYRAGDELAAAHYMGWGTSTFDADDILWGGFARTPTKNNYENEEVTRLVSEARTTMNDERRAELYGEAQEIIHDELPWLILFQQVDLYGVRSDLDWQPRPDQKIEVRTISRAE
ncbi:MAG: ABC transporter substrate-binding protein [Trueperaceae bacterium]|nr:ABC transporter substrate-binding protein [Trueperaceae bacterium]